MTIKSLWLAGGLCVFCATGLLALKTASQANGRSQESRPRFYAKEVLDYINVTAPGNALGETDGRFAEIRSGGKMTVLMASLVYFSDAADDGIVVTRGDGQYGLAGLFRMNEEGEAAWQPLYPGGTRGGYKLGSVMFTVTQSTDTIRIVNDDTRSVYVDAVIGFRREERGR